MNLRTTLRVVISTAVLVAATWWVLRSADMALMADLFVHSSWGLLLASVPVILVSHVIRASRWIRLLSKADVRPGFSAAFSSVMIGYAANTLIPRSGELLRPYVLTRRSSIAYATTLSSVVVERILDLITLLFGIAILVTLRSDVVSKALPGFTVTTMILAFAVPALAMGVLLILVAFTNVGARLINALIRPFHAPLADRAVRFMQEVRVGAAALTDRSTWGPVILESALIWAVYIVPLWLVLEAMPWQGAPFTFADAGILLIVTAIGVTIAPTPGAVGVYQGFAQVAMIRIYGATPTEGLAFGVLAWVMNYGVALVVGGLFLVLEMRRGLRWSEAAATAPDSAAATRESSKP